MDNIYNQEICFDCVVYLEHGEINHENERHFDVLLETLKEWREKKYFPYSYDSEQSGDFSHKRCDLCNNLPGTRFIYQFKDKKDLSLRKRRLTVEIRELKEYLKELQECFEMQKKPTFFYYLGDRIHESKISNVETDIKVLIIKRKRLDINE